MAKKNPGFPVPVGDDVSVVPRSVEEIVSMQQVGGETVVEWAYGRWDQREQLDYIPINKTREV